MLIDLVEKFQKATKENPSLLLNDYQLKEGIYLRFDINKTFEVNIVDIEKNIYVHSNNGDEVIENREQYEWFRCRDFSSSMINDDTNKIIDLPGKKIHSVHYLTFFVKKDTILGEKRTYTVDALKEHMVSYYEKLEKSDDKFVDAYPIGKGTKSHKEIMLEKRAAFFKEYYPDFLRSLEDTSRLAKIEKCKRFLLDNIHTLVERLEKLDEKYPFKNYIRIFFEDTLENYQLEHEKYLFPRIFTVDAFNYSDEMDIKGLPSGDMTVNSKKPFLLLKTLKTEVPLRISTEEAIARKDLFQWLSNRGKFKIHPFSVDSIFTSNDSKVKAQYHLSLDQSGSIQYYENVPFKNEDKLVDFEIRNILNLSEKVDERVVVKGNEVIDTYEQLKLRMSKDFFRGRMNGSILYDEPGVKSNEFTKMMGTYFLQNRQALYDFFYKGTTVALRNQIDTLTMGLIMEQLVSCVEGLKVRRMAEAYNLRIELLRYFKVRGGENMGDCIKETYSQLTNKLHEEGLALCENDEQFYFLAGQLGYYLLSQSEANNKTIGMMEPLLRVKYAHQLKLQIDQLLLRYGHAVNMNNRMFTGACAMVMGYEPTQNRLEGKNREMFVAGLLAANIFYKKSEKGVNAHVQMV